METLTVDQAPQPASMTVVHYSPVNDSPAYAMFLRALAEAVEGGYLPPHDRWGRDTQVIALVEHITGRITGIAAFHSYKNGLDPVVVPFLFHVLPEYRQRGLARTLCSALVGHAQSRGCLSMTFSVAYDHEPSRYISHLLGGRNRFITKEAAVPRIERRTS